jgi:hypothetical protein
MSRKITLTALILTLFLITAVLFAPPSQAVEWSADLRLTLDEGSDSSPSITQTIDGNIWVVWSSSRTDSNMEIFYKVHNGSWSDAVRLTANSADDVHPAIMGASDGKIWVVWVSDRTEPGGNYEIFYKVHNGSWSDATQLTTYQYWDCYPAIMEDNYGNIWVVWESDRNENDLDIYYKVFNGSSWSDAMPAITDPLADDRYPSIMQDMEDMIWIAFTKLTETSQQIYYKVFNGTSWSNDFQLTWDPGEALHPSITQAGDGAIWVVWHSERTEQPTNIYYKVYDTHWTPDTKLTTHQKEDYQPSITQTADGTIWVVWTSTRGVNFDIYYKTTVNFPYHDIAVIRVRANPTIVARGENVSIEVTTQNQGTYAETFEVQCHANSTLVGSTMIFLSPGQTNIMYPPFVWNTTGVSRGLYVISATVIAVTNETDLADNYREADELVEVRLLGDISGWYDGEVLPIPNGMVDGTDFAVICLPKNLFTEYPTWDPVWGPVCDLNEDGQIGMADLMIVATHYGET